MNEITCLERVQMLYPQFTSAERKVADYVMQNPHKVIYMSISELAEASGTGDTTVFRFCKTMKLEGYQEFKTLLSLGLKAENIDIKEQEKNGSGRLDGNAESSLSRIIDALNVTYRQLDEKKFQAMIDYMIKAPHIYFYGVGFSSAIARVGLSRFLRIFPRTCHFEDPYMQIMSATMLRPDDVAIIISYSGASRDTLEIAKLAHSTGCHVVVITRFSNSPITKYAETVLLSGDSQSQIESGSMPAGIAQLYIIELIYNECYKRRFAISSIVDGRIQEVLSEKNVGKDKKEC